MKNRVFVITGTLVLICSFSNITDAASVVGIVGSNKNCLADYSEWEKKRGWKAFAVTAEYTHGQGCGYSSGYDSKSLAVSEALRRCTEQLKSNISNAKNTCRVISVVK
jgi:hypothetical protein